MRANDLVRIHAKIATIVIILLLFHDSLSFTHVSTGSSLGALSGGRVAITNICAEYMSLAMVIAIRYCAVRRQFGPTDDNELPVIEYQTQVYILRSLSRAREIKVMIIYTNVLYALHIFNVPAMSIIASFSRNICGEIVFEGFLCAISRV